MADTKKNETAKDTANQITELELRVAKLEAQYASTQVFGDLFKDGCPSKEDVRDWVKQNPFISVGIAIVLTLLLTLIF